MPKISKPTIERSARLVVILSRLNDAELNALSVSLGTWTPFPDGATSDPDELAYQAEVDTAVNNLSIAITELQDARFRQDAALTKELQQLDYKVVKTVKGWTYRGFDIHLTPSVAVAVSIDWSFGEVKATSLVYACRAIDAQLDDPTPEDGE